MLVVVIVHPAVISIHAPRTGSDRAPWSSAARTGSISIHAPRTGSDEQVREHRLAPDISIHAPRTGSDRRVAGYRMVYKYFNPRSPHGERRFPPLDEVKGFLVFQSTLPARGATLHHCLLLMALLHFNPRSPHGERPPLNSQPQIVMDISIHAPRTGSDMRRDNRVVSGKISIHAPRTGSDGITPPFGQSPFISIHAPRTGSDREAMDYVEYLTAFQSTLPARGATPATEPCASANIFQSTLPARGATAGTRIRATRTIHFNPRSPHGERPARSGMYHAPQYFNPRSPHGERHCRNWC